VQALRIVDILDEGANLAGVFEVDVGLCVALPWFFSVLMKVPAGVVVCRASTSCRVAAYHLLKGSLSNIPLVRKGVVPRTGPTALARASEAVRAIAAGGPALANQVLSIGCSIKWMRFQGLASSAPRKILAIAPETGMSRLHFPSAK
jgi:hypothetical protein